MDNFYIMGGTADVAFASISLAILPFALKRVKGDVWNGTARFAWLLDFVVLSIASAGLPILFSLAQLSHEPQSFVLVAAEVRNITYASIALGCICMSAIAFMGNGYFSRIIPFARFGLSYVTLLSLNAVAMYLHSRSEQVASMYVFGSVITSLLLLIYSVASLTLLQQAVRDNPVALYLDAIGLHRREMAQHRDERKCVEGE